MSRLIGYARVSTNGQTLDSQIEALEAAAVSVIFQETASGARADRAQLARAIGALRVGDTLIVTRLDRLARSTRDEAKDGSMGFDFAGTYTKVIQHKLIEYAFGDRTAQVDFTPGPTDVTVRVTFDSEQTHSIEQQREGWQSILNSFARYVEAKKKA
jgi:Resolvase, N terminal domain/Activator of Hsp90 ATPase homolog 1-like protein